MIKKRFGFEELEVWQLSIEFATLVINTVENIPIIRRHYRLVDQIQSSVTSIALNIAEGKGRYSKREFIQFLYIARGSLYETVALLVIFQKSGWIDEAQVEKFQESAEMIMKKISCLINSIKATL